MIKYHKIENDTTVAEILPGSGPVENPWDMLDIMAETGYNGSTGIIIHSTDLNGEFFDLKTGVAGEILQKFSNYRMRLAIIGDFSQYKSKSLSDFIRESNNHGTICFTGSVEEALKRLVR